MTVGRRAPRRGWAPSANARYAAALTASACLAVTLVLNVAPQLDPTIGSRRLHVFIETAAAMVLVFIAAVLLGRFRMNGSRRTLLKVAAVTLLAADNLLSAALTTLDENVSAHGFSTWASATNGALGAVLLAGAALLPDRPVRRGGHVPFVILGTSFGLFGLMVVASALLADLLPGALANPPETSAELRLLSENPALIVTEAFTASCWAAAAVGFARLADAHEDEFLKWLSIGAVVGAVAFVNYTLFPSQFTELLYTGDLFFLAAIAVLLVGAVREISREEAAMIRSAVLEERRRVARDLHDGVAQELAFIASQMQWFIREPAERQPLAQIMDAVERALDESRGAIAALSRPMDESLDAAVGHAAQDVANRVGARLQLNLGDGFDVSSDWRDALLRITREAVANAVRHGHARTVTVQLGEGDAVWLRVIDDGEGFDLDAPRSSQSFGLTSMRERTESLGGRFAIVSARGQGTTVEVQLP